MFIEMNEKLELLVIIFESLGKALKNLVHEYTP